MESTGEGGGEIEIKVKSKLGLGFKEVETSSESLRSSEVFHVVKELIGFVLYMHHQIPSVLQNLEDEFNTLKEEFKCLESILPPAESKPSFRRQHNMQKRVVKLGIKRLEKLMNAISTFLLSLQQALDASPGINGIILALGSSPTRAQHVYEMSFPQGCVVSGSAASCSKSKVSEALSRKAIRTLISCGAGSYSYTGPTKLFLLVKSQCASKLPHHFLPKRDFKYHKKVVPFRLHIKCKKQVVGDSRQASDIGLSSCFLDTSLDNEMWFQCKHTVKGLASKAPETDC